LKEDNIKLESSNNSLEDRILDKDRELDRMRAELGVMERMISNLSSKNGREPPTYDEYYGRDSIDRSNRLSSKRFSDEKKSLASPQRRPKSKRRARF
jgi:hypothetical protein